MSNKAKYMEMTFPVANDCVKACSRSCCCWGQRKSTYDKDGNLKGGATPLWENPSKTFYKVMSALTLLTAVIFIGSYVAIQHYNYTLTNNVPVLPTNSTVTEIENSANNKSCVELSHAYIKSFFIIIGSAVLLINCFYYCFLACVEYASDEEWSRYLIIHVLFWIALVGFIIGDFLTVIISFLNSIV